MARTAQPPDAPRSFRLPGDLDARLSAAARETGLTKSHVVRRLLERGLRAEAGAPDDDARRRDERRA